MKNSGISFKKSHMLIGMSIPLFMFVFFRLIPTAGMAGLSLTEFTRVGRWDTLNFIGLDHFRHFFTVLNIRDVTQMFSRTLIYAFSVAIIQNGIALLLALLLNYKFLRGKTFYRAVVFMPVVLGVTITVATFRVIFNPISGPAAQFLGMFGQRSDFFGDPGLAFPLTIFTHIWMYIGFSLVIYLAGLQAISNELKESSYLDGAGGFNAFRYITLPLIWPTVVLSMTFTLLNTLQDFTIILLATGGNNNTMTLGMYMQANAFGAMGHATTPPRGVSYAAAVSWIMFAFTMIITLATRWVIKRKEVDVA